MTPTPLAPQHIRYIKLGRGGAWADDALRAGTIPFGYHAVSHEACEAGDWSRVRAELAVDGKTPSGVTQALRQVQHYYTLGEQTLWVTVAAGHLWWAFAAGPVIDGDHRDGSKPSRHRATRQGWRKTSLAGEPLTTLSLSSALIRTANYQMTICRVEREDYLLRRINGEPDPLHAMAVTLQHEIRLLAADMVAQLHWQDLESLADLIFARDGWRRVGVLGQDQPDVDLVVEHATTGSRAWVQVKARATQAELDANIVQFRSQGVCDRFYFVCAQPAGRLRAEDDGLVKVWSGGALADAAIDAGLFSWLIDRTR